MLQTLQIEQRLDYLRVRLEEDRGTLSTAEALAQVDQLLQNIQATLASRDGRGKRL
jgi:hypothetical protein